MEAGREGWSSLLPPPMNEAVFGPPMLLADGLRLPTRSHQRGDLMGGRQTRVTVMVPSVSKQLCSMADPGGPVVGWWGCSDRNCYTLYGVT